MGKKNVVWNDYISKNERFADFINGVIFQGKQMVLPKDLKALDSKLRRREYDRNSYHEYIRDTVKMWKYQGEKYIFDLEPEESPHRALPVKYMNYESLEYDRQYKEILRKHRKKQDLSSGEYLSGFAESDTLVTVITIGIYLGEKKWSGFTCIDEMIKGLKTSGEVSKCLRPFCNRFHVNIVDIHCLETNDIFQTDLREVFGFLKRQGDKKKLKQYVEQNPMFYHMREDAFDVLCTYSESRELAVRKEEYRTEGGMNMCTALRELKEEGREEGREEGKAALGQLIYKLLNEGRMEDLSRASIDANYRNELLVEYGING